MVLDFVLESFWHQVGAKLGPKVDLEGSKTNLKKHEKKVTQCKMRQANGGGGSLLIEQYKQPDCRQPTRDARLADRRHFRPYKHSTGAQGTVADNWIL